MTQAIQGHTTAEVLEFQVNDLEEAVAYYGDEVAELVVQGLRRSAHIQIDGGKIILRAMTAEPGMTSKINRKAATGRL